MQIVAKNEQETGDIAARLAADLRPGDIIALRGDLGLGKTVFARALIRALVQDPGLDVPSPTFTLVQTYESGRGFLWHFDLYRLKNPQEVYELGWEEALAGSIVLIEWPERLGGLLPANRLDISLYAVENNPDHRAIQINRI